ncbi:MAG: diacylglycerol kinase family lipid kinase [Prevotellaceae bacterium]|jgi:YegS/Rv2252/BmrU family lipid kinase|nr:diacylglycerol kinase family lipid kinase [Prevotellaceae bacterium]
MGKVAFIINPVSGTQSKEKIPTQVSTILNKTQFEPQFFYTERAGHATELAAQLAAEGYEYVVAVGGDGTVNEVGKGLIHTDTAMGIIPCGSGNGLARHLGIPVNTKKAVEYLKNAHEVEIDYCKANDRIFFCTCGTGFDAQISYEFALADGRGIRTYIKKIVAGLLNYKPQTYCLKNKEISFEQEAFLITFANASQYGNNAYIAPHADLQDGLMDIAILSHFPLVAIPGLAIRLFTKQIDKSSYMTTLQVEEITLQREKGGAFHFDGEAGNEPETVNIKVIQKGLKILVN